MEQQDDWLEGVRRWYFGGEAPEGAERDEQIVWPSAAAPQPAATPVPTPVQWARGATSSRSLPDRGCQQACTR